VRWRVAVQPGIVTLRGSPECVLLTVKPWGASDAGGRVSRWAGVELLALAADILGHRLAGTSDREVEMKAHLKTAVFASGFTRVLTMTASAIAGNGVGGIFNLGQTNTVNVTSTLSGTKDGALLSVSNPNAGTAATGVNVATATAKPPLTVNSSAPSPAGSG
jgi:hypothetical protein